MLLNGPTNLVTLSKEAELPVIISGLFVQGLGVGMLLILGNIQLLHIAKREYMDTSKAVINA